MVGLWRGEIYVRLKRKWSQDMVFPPDDCIKAGLYSNRNNTIETGNTKERIIPGKDNCKSRVLEMARVSRI